MTRTLKRYLSRINMSLSFRKISRRFLFDFVSRDGLGALPPSEELLDRSGSFLCDGSEALPFAEGGPGGFACSVLGEPGAHEADLDLVFTMAFPGDEIANESLDASGKIRFCCKTRRTDHDKKKNNPKKFKWTASRTGVGEEALACSKRS